MATTEELEARIESLETTVGIQRALASYSLLVDLGRWEDVGNLFTEDAILEIAGYGSLGGIDYDGVHRTRPAITAYYAGNSPGLVGPPRSKHNIIPGPISDDGGGSAVFIAYLLETPPRTRGNPGGGLYEARMRRQSDGTWKFAHLRIVATGETRVAEAISGEV
ncbi:MAG TPA: nuclear transport factor 2 family protein [Dehalococcoidia bacterium]|nr:nuclear transport factor 2 family protein [Dehalococcoidia bacterium]